jgi:amidase
MPAQPTPEQLRDIAQMYGMHMSGGDIASMRDLISAAFESYDCLDQLTEPAPPPRYARSGAYRPHIKDNPLNAWYQRCSIKGAASGLLAGKRIAIKDNVCVAGVPMMNGSSLKPERLSSFRGRRPFI